MSKDNHNEEYNRSQNQADCFRMVEKYDGTVLAVLRQDLPKGVNELTVPTIYHGQAVNSLRFGASCGITAIHIPADITEIIWDKSGCENSQLRSITIDEENPTYCTDGYALFDKTREILLQMVCCSLEQYSVPEGTRMLGEEAFAGCKLKEIVLPTSLQEIGKRAFRDCKNLTAIKGIEAVDKINLDAVEETPWLQNKSVWIQNKTLMKYQHNDEEVYRIPEGVEIIGADSFSRSALDAPTALSEIFFPDSMKEISRYAFYSCKNLKVIHCNKGLEKIDSFAFVNCHLLKDIMLPTSLKELGNQVFDDTAISAFQVAEGNTSFTSKDGILYSADMSILLMVPEQLQIKIFEVPDGVKEIQAYAFKNQMFLEQVILPKSVEIIHNNAFMKCMRLTQVRMAGVKEIEFEAFTNCNNLNRIVLSEGLREIKVRAFDSCSVEQLSLPESVRVLGKNAFGRVKALEVYDSIEPEVKKGSSALGSFVRSEYRNEDEDYDVIVRCSPTGEIKYRVTMAGKLPLLWGPNGQYDFVSADKEFPKLDKDQKIRMAAYRLMYPVDLTAQMKETYEKYLVRMAKAFVMHCIDQKDMKLLLACESVEILKKNNIDELSDYALKKEALEFSAYLLEYKKSKFSGNKTKKTVISELEHSIDTLKAAEWKMSSSELGSVMRYRGEDVEVVFPETVEGKTVIGIANSSAKTPENYKNIISVTIPEGYLHIGKYAFKGCEKLEKISLPSTLQTIDKAAFQECYSLKEIDIPDSVISIGEDVFARCTSLTKVRLSRKLWNLPASAFGSCHSLRTIDIPSHVGSLSKGCLETNGVLTVNLHGLYVNTMGKCFGSEVRINHYPCGFSEDPYGVPLTSRCLMNLADQPGRLSVVVLMKDRDKTSQELSFEKEMTDYTIQRNEAAKLDQLINGITDKKALFKFLTEIYREMEKVINDAVWTSVEKELVADIEIRETKESEDGKTVTIYQYCFETGKGKMVKQDTYTVETKHNRYESLRQIEDRIINRKKTSEEIDIEKWFDITSSNQESKASPFAFSDVEEIDFPGHIFVLSGFGFVDEIYFYEEIEKRGGTIKDTVVQKTDYLIMNENYEKVTAKYKKAVELNQKGKNIIILSKSQFDKIIDA